MPQDIGNFPNLRDWKPGGLKMARKRETMPSQHTDITPTKARTMLREGVARGHKLTEKQRGFLGAVASKGRKRG